jgi:uncharacterized membrane protein
MPDDTQPCAAPAPLSPFQRFVERLLFVAVVLCVVLMAAGILLALLRGDGLPDHVVALALIPSAMATGDPAAFLSLGLLVLIGTPVLRVGGALLQFGLQRDWRYVAVTAAVLTVMAVSLVLGRS